jgi:hypothetical protein
MKKAEFQTYLEGNKVESKQISEFIKHLEDYEQFLSGDTLQTCIPEKIIEYSDYLVSQKNEPVLNFLRAIIHYATFTKRYELITKVIDISESYNAMDNLYSRVAEFYGEAVRDESFNGLTIPPLGVDPGTKPEFTKLILRRLNEQLGEKKVINLLSPCLHGRPPDDIEGDKKLLKKLGIDGFLEKKHQDLIARLERHRDEGTLEFAQNIDDEIVEIVRGNQMIAEGIRKGTKIFVSKLPYQMRAYLDAKDHKMKRFFLCYCPWIRGALKDGTEKELTEDFCYCSAGWYKLYWDQIFEQSVEVELIESALKGAVECKFAIHIPEVVNISSDLITSKSMNK